MVARRRRVKHKGQMSELPTTDDRFLGGRLILTQPAKGYRAGMDAVVLAAACDVTNGRVLDAGCGFGAVMLAAAVRCPGSRFVGVERSGSMLALAQKNIEGNGLGERVTAIGGDIAGAFTALSLTPFDAALANPPFFDDPSRLRTPRGGKATAFVTGERIAAWCGFLLDAVREGGSLTLIHRPEMLADLLAALSARAGAVQIRPVQPFADAPAKRIVVRCIKGGRAPLRLLSPLALHVRKGAKHTVEAEALLRGAGALSWS